MAKKKTKSKVNLPKKKASQTKNKNKRLKIAKKRKPKYLKILRESKVKRSKRMLKRMGEMKTWEIIILIIGFIIAIIYVIIIGSSGQIVNPPK